MFEQSIEPIDTCGCGDVGFLTTRSIPIDLAHGVGQIDNVPVYHCHSTSCREFTLPPIVSRRLEDIAEQMENSQSTVAVYTWESLQAESPDFLQRTNEQIHLQTFTLQFGGREYADARVFLIIPSQAIFFKSTLEDTEYYLLRYDAETRTEGTWFSFLKFYYQEPELTYEDFLEWSEEGHLKELGRITLDEVEDTLIDEFGDWT
ncbi:hypothetical protein [Desulfosporosinus sp. Sb-LF]|uniref:hypothetical protein n=1 Tax=Desulfosporosinus sp. Sb-LF TaxID=2560027 RepID=UPI00107F46F3|nr:hypothetical protein [Desulfosporosinus sp. Sb-LF]TGE32254.1 hypothetical protein E4K68_11630 [Desulfosporosinus sp. Sb-LF]